MEFVNKTDILVFYVNAFDSITDKGEQLKGCSVHYLFFGDNGFAVQGQCETDVSVPIGMQRGKSWVDYSLREKITVAPAIYEGEFVMAVDSKGKTAMKLKDVAFKSFVKMEPYNIPDFYVPGMIGDTSMPDFDKPEATEASDENKPVTSPDSAQASDRKNKR